MNWFVAPKTKELTGKALLIEKLSDIISRLEGCKRIHDFWKSDMLICQSELENASAEFRFDLGPDGIAKLAASGAAIKTAIRQVNSNMPKAIRFVGAAARNLKVVLTDVQGVDPSEAETLELGMDDWAQQLAEARSQLPAGIDWHLD